jgi:hypothetical protein
MKTGILASPTIASDDMQRSVMGMSSKGMDIASYFLRDKIYSDKILAVVREYTSNAVDEHRKHNITQYVYVSLFQDTDGKSYWSVRDYALGLDDDAIRNVFGMYFESTKGGDNDSIGGFGIGSKAGLCYSDTFYITSWNNGLKTSYISSLGAGTKGVPVGEIYDLSKELTTEQGLEIKIEVQPHDLYKFREATSRLVRGFTNDVGIVYDDVIPGYTDTFKPETPLKTMDIAGGYKLSSYLEFPTVGSGGTSAVSIRMGGIVYATKTLYRFSSDMVGVIGHHVVDVPIGKLSLPISRETIEQTPANDKVIADITLELNKLLEEDKKTITVPKFGELLDAAATDVVKDNNNYNSYYGPQLSGEWFTYKARQAFPDTYRLLDSIRRTTYTTIPRDSSGNHTIYLIPDIKNPNGWMERLDIVAKTLPGYVGHFTAINAKRVQDYIASLSVNVSDIDFIDVKALKLPPLPKKEKSTVQYLVFLHGYRKGSYTPEGLETFVKEKIGEVDLDSNWWETVTDTKDLFHRTIATNSSGSYARVYFTANSEKMVTGMYDLGWLAPTDQEYIDTLARLEKEQKEKDRVERAEPSLRANYFDTEFHPNIVKALIRNPDKIDRLLTARLKLINEDSTRGRILRKLSKFGNYDGERKISRTDLRKILTLK